MVTWVWQTFECKQGLSETFVNTQVHNAVDRTVKGKQKIDWGHAEIKEVQYIFEDYNWTSTKYGPIYVLI